MSMPVDGDESYLGQNLSVSQLLYAAKSKLQCAAFGERIATTSNETEVEILERDAVQVLSMVRSIKNSFAAVNRTPPEVLSLIPDYWEGSDRDEVSIKLTHVCRSWREVFVSRPSLWTRLDCKNVEKTKVYIERLKTSPFEIFLNGLASRDFRMEAFNLMTPHIGRSKSLSISNWPPPAPVIFFEILFRRFSCVVPLLEKLKINLKHESTPALSGRLFSAVLSSLRELDLTGILMPRSWKGLNNLTTFSLSDVPGRNILLTHLLNFSESSPRLRDVLLKYSIPGNSNAPPERIVSLPNLKKLKAIARTPNSVLLHHLSIPPGTLVVLEFTFRGARSPIPFHIPDTLDNLHNISHITTMNLCFGPERRAIQLNGPSGQLYIHGTWVREGARSRTGTTRLVRFLDRFDTSRCRRLGITRYRCPLPVILRSVYQLLYPMNNLRTLTLIESNSLPFILALDPDENSNEIVLCPKLEEIVLYIKPPFKFHVNELLRMAKKRTSRDARLSAIMIVSAYKLAPSMELSGLRKHVSRVERMFDDVPPAWDTLPGNNPPEGNL